MAIVLFEDSSVSDLYPAALARPAFAISCGASRLVDVAGSLERPIGVIVRSHLKAIVQADYPELTVGLPAVVGDGPVLLANARLVPSAAVGGDLARLLDYGKPGVATNGKAITAAVLPADALGSLAKATSENVAAKIAALKLPEVDVRLPLLARPHDIVRYHLHTMGENLAARIAAGEYQEVQDKVFVSEGVTISGLIAVDSSAGPIVLEEGVAVGPLCYLKGPLHVERHARIVEHASLKDCVAVGRGCKIGGEVEASIFEPFTNKAHHGFIGHSYLGSWINLGAGTSNSDLKNTYGKILADYGGLHTATGMQFFGAVVGDYTKTAINTSIFTGKMVGVCSMLYGVATTNVPSFCNYARQFGQLTSVPVEVMVATQGRMFARRNVAQRECDIQLLHDMHALTLKERDPSKIPVEPLTF